MEWGLGWDWGVNNWSKNAVVAYIECSDYAKGGGLAGQCLVCLLNSTLVRREQATGKFWFIIVSTKLEYDSITSI
ncbi:hypothetical protein M0804_011801 [Polistes exclamans]|nr:hypothetical protein M0804_011801 [Polistes exclamans]